jgi:hypothetical protein
MKISTANGSPLADAHTRRMAMLRAGALLSWPPFSVWRSPSSSAIIALKRIGAPRKTAALDKEPQAISGAYATCFRRPSSRPTPTGHLTFLNQSGYDMLGVHEASVPTGIHLSDFLPGESDFDQWDAGRRPLR